MNTNPYRDEGADPEGEVLHPADLVGLSASLHLLAKDIAGELMKSFPGFLWAIAPDQRGGIIDIFCLNFHDQWGYTIRIADIQDDPKRREALRAGAEILRRFRYPGTRYDAQLANNVPRDINGKAIPDLSDHKANRMTEKASIALAISQGRAKEVVGPDGQRMLRVTE